MTIRYNQPYAKESAMMIELNAEQKQVLDRAAQSGMSPDEVLDQAFAVIREQQGNGDWMMAEREAVAAHIAEGFAQAERGELVDAEDVARILHERRAKRHIA
jgi:predicted transcriptional regulator